MIGRLDTPIRLAQIWADASASLDQPYINTSAIIKRSNCVLVISRTSLIVRQRQLNFSTSFPCNSHCHSYTRCIWESSRLGRVEAAINKAWIFSPSLTSTTISPFVIGHIPSTIRPCVYNGLNHKCGGWHSEVSNLSRGNSHRTCCIERWYAPYDSVKRASPACGSYRTQVLKPLSPGEPAPCCNDNETHNCPRWSITPVIAPM